MTGCSGVEFWSRRVSEIGLNFSTFALSCPLLSSGTWKRTSNLTNIGQKISHSILPKVFAKFTAYDVSEKSGK